jgi:hypothetical protein
MALQMGFVLLEKFDMDQLRWFDMVVRQHAIPFTAAHLPGCLANMFYGSIC